MNRKLLHLVFAAAFSGLAALGVASDSDFVADEIRGLHSELADTRRWVDSDIRANLAHRWETIPNRLAERGFGWAESGLESLSWIPNADLAVESDSAGRLAGFSAGGTGLLWTGESAAVGFQPWGRWTDGGENDAASFGVFSRRALGDWVVVGGNVFADYAASAEFGDFARWSAGLDFQSPLGELRGNYYAGLSSTRENVGLENRVLAYAPSGVDAELRLRWFGGSEWSGFAEYEKWAGQFGDSDLEEVGYGLSFRPAGGGLLAGLWVDAGFRDLADSAEHWNLRLGYSRRLGADNSVPDSGSAFAVRSALVSPVAREREVEVRTVELPNDLSHFAAQSRAAVWSGDFVIFNQSIIGNITITSTLTGQVADLNVPFFSGATLDVWLNSHPERFTISADNLVSVVAGAQLLGKNASWIRASLTHASSTLAYDLYAGIIIRDGAHPRPWTIPPKRKIAHGYTGPLFTVTVDSDYTGVAFAFEKMGTAALQLGTYHQFEYPVNEGWFNAPPSGDIYSRDHGLMGRYSGGQFEVFARRPVVSLSPEVKHVYSGAYFYNHLPARLTLAFTLQALPPVMLRQYTAGDSLNVPFATLRFPLVPYDRFSVIGILPEIEVRSNREIVSVLPLNATVDYLLTVGVRYSDVLGQRIIKARIRKECTIQDYAAAKREKRIGVGGDEIDRQFAAHVSNEYFPGICKLLILGADPNFKGAMARRGANIIAQNLSPLHRILRYGADDENTIRIFELLDSAGANPNEEISAGSTPERKTRPIHLAAARSDRFLPVVAALGILGMDFNGLDASGKTPLMIAAENAEGDGIFNTVLLYASDVNMEWINNPSTCGTPNIQCARSSALHFVDGPGSASKARALIRGGVSLNATDYRNETAANRMARLKLYSALYSMVEAGADINIADIDGLAPIHWSALHTHWPSMEALLSVSGISVNAKTTQRFEHRFPPSCWKRSILGGTATLEICDERGLQTIDKGSTALDIVHPVSRARDILYEEDSCYSTTPLLYPRCPD